MGAVWPPGDGAVSLGRVWSLVGRRLALVVGLGLATMVAVDLSMPATAPGIERTDAERLSVEDLAQVSMLLAGATVRVSAVGCGLSTVGTGFAVNGMLLTNSHVVGASTAFSIGEPGRSGAGPAAPLLVPVRGNAPSVDLAFGPSPLGQELVSAGRDPVIGELVVLAGYGGGRRLSIVEARVSNVVAGRAYGSDGPAVLIEGPTAVGFSGGPVVDRNGRVVAVLRAYDAATGLTIAVPVSLVDEATRSRDMQHEEQPC